jgi:alkyl sulfatase BDS1-like metallo-beta-lactamase superfamily hydrolase
MIRRTSHQLAVVLAGLIPMGVAAQDASEHTRAANAALLESLPFEDQTDFENAKRGFIAGLGADAIANADGRPVYDLAGMDFLNGDAPDTANPSLWRQRQLNHISGLFEVTKGIYQIRNFDLSVMSFIRGETGWIVIDPLISVETAKAGFDLLKREIADLPVTGIILTHSHVDHFGGVKGIVTEEEVAAGNIPVIAPAGFYEESIGENLIAGNTMSRRASYMFGNLLPKGPDGMIGAGLGNGTSSGTITILKPTVDISETPTTLTVDGVEMEFLFTPGNEAPAELMFWLPEYKAMMQAEEINHVMHNLYTLRGTKVRSGDLWAKYIHDVINRYGDEVEISFGSHHWPTWGRDEILDFWRGQRDVYRFIHDETLRLANKGYTMLEIAEQIELSEGLATQFANRGYYGSVSHNAKAQYQLYFGWFSGNPAELHELPPAEEGAKFVEYAGGADAVIEKARADYEAGNYRWAATALNHVVFADGGNTEAKDLLADTYTQLGYQAESGPWRNFYLTGAKELRDGVTTGPAPNTGSADIIRGLPIEKYLDFLAMRLNHPAAADADITLNFEMPDVDQRFIVEIGNGVMNYTMDDRSDDAGASVTLDRAVLDRINLQQQTFPDAIKAGDVKIEGDPQQLLAFLGLLDSFDFWFNIVTD